MLDKALALTRTPRFMSTALIGVSGFLVGIIGALWQSGVIGG